MSENPESCVTRGRPRDAAIDTQVLDAALQELATRGYAAFSLASVAEAAGTTRPAIYRRWPDKAALIVDAVARLAEAAPPEPTGEPYADLVDELANFAHCIAAAGAEPLAGLMLGDEVDGGVRQAYLDQLVAPRRGRIRGILAAASERGLISPDADLEVAGTFLTGSWYAYRVADRTPPADWAPRTAALVWRACGGTPPARRGGAGSRTT